LDGTLLNNSAEISEYTKKTLNGLIAKGLHFTAATARTPDSAKKLLAGVNINVPIVLMNGALIYDIKSGKYVKVYELTPETAAGVLDAIKDFTPAALMYKLIDGKLAIYHEDSGHEPIRDFIAERTAKYKVDFRRVDNLSRVSPDYTIYFSMFDTLERLTPAREALESRPGLNITMYKDTYTRDLWFLEIFNAAASKKNAAAFLRKTYGYERIVGFGDNLNDLPMFEACDVKIAVKNARPEVQAAADHICGSNEEDGVAAYIAEAMNASL